jgi:WD40 repeat protein
MHAGVWARELHGNRTALPQPANALSRLELGAKLDGHRGCVNSLTWSRAGDLLLSGSDDLSVGLWRGVAIKPHGLQPSFHHPGHSANIFAAQFVPSTGNHAVVTAGLDGDVRLTQLGAQPHTYPEALSTC